MGFFRYPGGKSKLKKEIIPYIESFLDGDLEYREPFFGGGSIGLTLLDRNQSTRKVWINDKDLGISCLWTAVIRYPELLKKMVRGFEPSVEKFDEFKQALTDENLVPMGQEIAEHGFKKLAIHLISYSGLGTRSGGPLGGRKPDNIAGRGSTPEVKYPIDCRWSPEYICKKIDEISWKLAEISLKLEMCSCLDFADLLQEDREAVIYLDPPYYVKGNDLYQFGMSDEDHQRLAALLRKSRHRWVLSYDDCPEVRELYGWARIEEIGVKYTIRQSKDDTGECVSRNKVELIIMPR
jgi:DNA adenine methylase